MKKQKFHTGAQRDQRINKGRYDLISPIWLRQVAIVLENGAKHYGDRNWEKGIPICRTIDSAIRHLQQFLERKTDENHLANCTCNLMFLAHTLEMINRGLLPKELDDRPNYERPAKHVRRIK